MTVKTHKNRIVIICFLKTSQIINPLLIVASSISQSIDDSMRYAPAYVFSHQQQVILTWIFH